MTCVKWSANCVWIPIAMAMLLLSGCEGPEGPAGSACSVTDNGDGTATIACEDGTTATVVGPDGTDGDSCTATDNMDGTVTIDCEDGTSVTVSNGTVGDSCSVTDNMDGTATIACDDGTMVVVSDGVAGSSCSVADNGDGTSTITCDNGTVVTVADGVPGVDAGYSPVLAPVVTVSTPPNGTHFVTGDVIVITIELWDGDGNPVDPSELNTNRLYMAGPRAATLTESAVELLGANEDRTIQPHHYINLGTTTASNLVVAGNVLTFTTNAVTTEPAGTYDIGFRGRMTGFDLTRVFILATAQIGVAAAETTAFDGCSDCHLGPDTNQLYFHHVDGGGSTGSFEIDNGSVTACKLCHNNDGYASIRLCADGTKAESLGGGNYICGDGSSTYTYLNDSIMRRAHGLHNGNNLVSTLNVGAFNPDFHDYDELVFPADIKNCTKCHSDDRWMDNPATEPCATCHDGANFASPALGILCNDASDPDLCDHPGGLDLTDASCGGCHGTGTGVNDIPVVHAIAPPVFAYTVTTTMSAPANGTHFVDGEMPVLTVAVADITTGAVIDPNSITEATWNRARLMVYGPRADSVPVLTTISNLEIRAEVESADGPWDFTGLTALDFDIDGLGAISCLVSGGTFTDIAAVTSAEATTWITGCFAGSGTVHDGDPEVVILSDSRGVGSTVEILSTGDVAAAMGLVAGVYVPYNDNTYTYNDIRVRTDALDDDPRITRTAVDFTYALDDVVGLTPGTYIVHLDVRSGSSSTYGYGDLTFQVGTDVEDTDTATNCVDCHEDERMHGRRPMNSDHCKACHDYDNQLEGYTDWYSRSYGFGAGPLSRRIHGVHFAHYIDDPDANNVDGSEHIIFPMDVRNCTKCHSENDLYASSPDRLACSGCHDSTAEMAHMTLMTVDLTPADPFSGDELESCDVCHGLGSGLAVDVVHNIWDPWVKPYPRDP